MVVAMGLWVVGGGGSYRVVSGMVVRAMGLWVVWWWWQLWGSG